MFKHIGEEATVCGKVYGGKYLERTGQTFVNMGARYPNSPFTILIWGNNRNNFSYKPEEFLDGKMICAAGKISEYKGAVQIIASKESQIKISR